ncbi:CoA pyrophosphatase [Mesorhizobium sp. WSM4904]|uniref:CoA pyrophosphatase n=1 Tax=Mesorhizobium sp. WSM4904 TaxID=3038545 RepID=UPI0024181E05|nr:CoA pyrophosphatase [Mesorhizobium sp. WSM4904]WFP66033.1 CoA pyrophosphatase [Mesorhizobium sp. WSM4904]
MDQVSPVPFSIADFRARAAAQAKVLPGDEFGDHRFNPGHPRLKHMKPLRDAAVLIPVIDHADGATVLLTKRAERLRSHSGQVAFPGGTIDPTDPGPEATALRETFEEIGLDRGHIEIIGRMPDYISGSGYRIVPVLSVVRPGFSLTLNADEVDAAFEVPLRFLMDPVNHARDSRMWNDLEWFFYEMPYGGQRIWGVTAGIIRTLYERLYA